MNINVEIIDFYRPDSNRKNLFISNIPGTIKEDELVDKLTELFSPFGLLYGIQVYPSQRPVHGGTSADKGHDTLQGFYAFVNYFSAVSAAKAKDSLSDTLFIHGSECKIAYAKRQKEIQERLPLYVTKCYELVNYYLTFNGWSTNIKTLFRDEESCETTKDTSTLRYVCLVQLCVRDLHTDGIGVWQETYAGRDPTGRMQAICKCKKLAYHRAVENAFTKVLLVVLGNEKVTVEVDTTKPDFDTDIMPDDALVKVNELGLEPESEDGDTIEVQGREDCVSTGAGDLDDLNLHILQELEDDM